MSKEFKANQNQKLDNQELNDWLDSLMQLLKIMVEMVPN